MLKACMKANMTGTLNTLQANKTGRTLGHLSLEQTRQAWNVTKTEQDRQDVTQRASRTDRQDRLLREGGQTGYVVKRRQL